MSTFLISVLAGVVAIPWLLIALSPFVVMAFAAGYVLMTLIGMAAEKPAETKTAKQNRARIPRVLIVDDDLDTLVLVAQVFRKLGCSTSLAADGEQALDKMKNFDFDLVIMDWLMPGMSGAETLRQVDRLGWDHATRGGADVLISPPPFVIYSAMPQAEMSMPETRNLKNLGFWPKRAGYRELREMSQSLIQNIAASPVM